jgi:NAD-dependent dihydropyrimidine dehydrogenase PreA subunit
MDAYDKLMEIVTMTVLPQSQNLRQILEIILTEEEAVLLGKLSMQPFQESLEQICRKTGMEPAAAEAMLESLADKGMAFARAKDGRKKYARLPMFPGWAELQLMKGGYDARSKKMAELFHAYQHEGFSEKSLRLVDEPIMRTIVVGKHVPVGQTIQPYEDIKQLILSKKQKGLTTCFCRHEKELIGQGCGRPKDVCMTLGPFADYLIERGYARRASDEQMLEALDRAEEAGLVHICDNIAEKINFVCNCCGCCCGILESVNKFNMPGVIANSNYIVSHDPDECINCGDCVERCQLHALKMDGQELVVDLKRCIGCGSCIRACGEDALTLKRRPDDEMIKPHGTYLEMGMALAQSIQRVNQARKKSPG